ncbi:hypothetical protein [Altererythrobacter sp. ZODW24]|uniref:hypothetical protein n=1 Tax=Altererythrobacter sp. ZODW24 TaxID=2185142 RepID=UPI000DF815E6|nr:hypothetical protein [Altererythrobacter sp. ZODW24]
MDRVEGCFRALPEFAGRKFARIRHFRFLPIPDFENLYHGIRPGREFGPFGPQWQFRQRGEKTPVSSGGRYLNT